METAGPAPTAAPVLIQAPLYAPLAVPAPRQLLHRFQFLTSPARLYRDSGSCRSFLVKYGLHFKLQASFFPTDHAKVVYITYAFPRVIRHAASICFLGCLFPEVISTCCLLCRGKQCRRTSTCLWQRGSSYCLSRPLGQVFSSWKRTVRLSVPASIIKA